MNQWQELFFEGAERVVRAFVVGFAAGRGESFMGVFGTDIELEPESFTERLRALFAAGAHHVLFAPPDLAAALAAAVAAHGKDIALWMEQRRTIESAAFSFRIETFSRELAT